MARPSKLTERQWADVERRALDGEPVRQLAREFGVSEAAIRKRVNTQAKPIKNIANQLAAAEIAYEALPISAQVKVRSLADSLKGVSAYLATAAENGAAAASHLSAIAVTQALSIRTDGDPGDNAAALKTVVALTATANEAAKIGLNLLAANKDMARQPEDEAPATLEHFYGATLPEPGSG